jgi:calcineurin-like phosphoesterase family protein
MKLTEPQKLESLLAKCALGDRAAFAELYAASASKLNGIAYRILNNTDSANEILQEAFVQIWIAYRFNRHWEATLLSSFYFTKGGIQGLKASQNDLSTWTISISYNL